MSTVEINHSSGARVVVDRFGATVVSWVLPSGKQVLYLSSLADRTGSKPIRGGIPVVFPQFSDEGPLMKHGFARVSIWTNDPVFEEDGYSICRFHLGASENTRSIWNYEFALTYEVRINADSLSTELKIDNTGDAPFECQCLLHTYYAVPSIAKTAVVGMRNHTGVESVTTGKRREFVEAEEKIVFSGETDVKFSKVANPVEIEAEDRKIHVEIESSLNGRENCPDCVVWNAWIDKCHSIGDMEDDDYKRYVCVEPGCVNGFKTVEAHQTLGLKQTIHVTEL